MSYIIGIDPGKKTGLVIFANVNFLAVEYTLAAHYTINWEDRYRLRDILLTHAADRPYIVVEDFILRADAQFLIGDKIPSAKVIERITIYCEQLGLVDRMRFQLAAQIYMRKGAKWPIPPEHLAILDKKYQHEKDAYLHARLFVQLYKHREVSQ